MEMCVSDYLRGVLMSLMIRIAPHVLLAILYRMEYVIKSTLTVKCMTLETVNANNAYLTMSWSVDFAIKNLRIASLSTPKDNVYNALQDILYKMVSAIKAFPSAKYIHPI